MTKKTKTESRVGRLSVAILNLDSKHLIQIFSEHRRNPEIIRTRLAVLIGHCKTAGQTNDVFSLETLALNVESFAKFMSRWESCQFSIAQFNFLINELQDNESGGHIASAPKVNKMGTTTGRIKSNAR